MGRDVDDDAKSGLRMLHDLTHEAHVPLEEAVAVRRVVQPPLHAHTPSIHREVRRVERRISVHRTPGAVGSVQRSSGAVRRWPSNSVSPSFSSRYASSATRCPWTRASRRAPGGNLGSRVAANVVTA